MKRDLQYFKKILGMFQRLHKRGEFAGTGIVLAICKKIVGLESMPTVSRALQIMSRNCAQSLLVRETMQRKIENERLILTQAFGKKGGG